MLIPARRALFVLMLAALPLRAAGPADTALGKVPADAEHFSSMLRMGEMVEIIGKSRAWNQIWNEPSVQGLWQMSKARYAEKDGDWAMIKEFLDNPANKDIPALLGDALSHEIFLYSGAGTGDTLALFQELIGGARYGPFFQQLVGIDQGNDLVRARARIVLTSLSEQPERIDIPDLVLGFKVSDSAKVAAQIKRLEPVLKDALKDTPLKGRAAIAKVGKDDFLVLNLDGSLVPWDKLPIADYEDKPGEFAPLLKKLKSKTLTVSLGVREGYLLLAIGESTDHLLKFGGAGPKLAGVNELKPLDKYSGKPITSISYTSAKLLEKVATTTEDIGGLTDVFKMALPQLDLPEDLQKAIEKDIDGLGRSLTSEITKPGAMLMFTFRTDRGWETFSYDSTPPSGPAPKPLTLLQHVGGNPILAAVSRSSTTVEEYQSFAKWAGRFGGHAEKVIKLKVPNADEGLKLYRDKFLPLIQELSDVTEKKWLPSLADGQQAFVLDAKLKSGQWHQVLPPSEKPLPMLEPALVLGVSDAKLFEDALDSYFKLANKLIAAAHAASPDEIPEFEIPKPSLAREKGRTYAFYPIPPFLGLDRQIQPTGALSDKVAALTISTNHANRLLDSTPFTPGLTPFADVNRPLESAVYFNWSGLIDAGADWLSLAEKVADPDGNQEAWKIGKKVVSLLKVFQKFGSVTYREGAATVTHSETILADLPPAK